MAKILELRLLGRLGLQRDGTPVAEIQASKTLALLSYLAVMARPHSRPVLAGLLWGGMPEAKARDNLSKALSTLRRVLGDHLTITRQTVTFNEDSDFWLDVAAFEAGANDHSIERLQEAVRLYEDDFLDGFYVRNAPEFEIWMLAQQARLKALVLRALHTLAAHFAEQDSAGRRQAIDYTRRLLAMEPWREEAHRQLMRLLAVNGQRGAALAQYETCRQVLVEELGVEPGVDTTALYEQIRDGDLGREAPESALLPESSLRLPRPPHNLPPQPMPFIGREEELVKITGLIQAEPACRLLTLIGPGGIGKTRLAIQAAKQAVADSSKVFPGGIYFVPLAALNSSDFLVSAIAEPLNLTFQGNADPKVQLLGFLGQMKQAMLLVLDNFEQLIEGADLLAAILQRAPAVKLLVTSRERLNLRDEWLLDIRGLPFPTTTDSLPSREGLGEGEGHNATSNTLFRGLSPPPQPSPSQEEGDEDYSALQLFEQRARQVQASFDLTTDYPAVSRICQLVEGMPLGLELAAAWVRLLTCQEIAIEIEKSLEFLTTLLRDVPVRHHSLAAVFDHSWNHLSSEEQRVFRSLAVFRGGFSREAAEQVVGTSVPLLAALMDKSMLRRNEAGRYELHELLRQYGAEKLEEAGEMKRLRDRHLTILLKLAAEAEPELQGANQIAWLERLNIESGNLRAALEWSLEEESSEAGLRLTVALGQFWLMRGHLFGEGIEWLEKVLSGAESSASTALQARAFRWLGRLGSLRGDDVKARSAYEKSLAFYRELQDKEGIADALYSLGSIVGNQSDEAAARSFYAEARSYCEESLAILRQGNDKWKTGNLLNHLGEMARVTGDYAAARSFYEESLAIRRALGDQRGTAISLINLGFVANYQGDYRQATTFFAESLALFQKHDGKRGIVDCVAGLGGVAAGMKQPERAARLLGAAQVQYETFHFRLEYPDRIENDRDLATVRAQLDTATFAVAWAEGRQLTLGQAIEEALTVGEFVQASARSRPVPPPPHNLPPQPTPFIGREEELAEITHRLTDPACRLLTLVGSGGIGKTRLALEAAARLLPAAIFEGGIYFVPLAALTSTDFLVSTLADPLKFSFQGDTDPKVQLLNFLAKMKQAMLLVLDNFEQLVEGAELLAAILQQAPVVKLLVTSRERLNLREEWVLDIVGLPFPTSVQPVEGVEAYSAVQLFLQRAARLDATFTLSIADVPHLVRICQLVEGMPLGLELAAAWVRVLSCREIAQEIEESLDFLTISLRDVPARHRSLAAVFDHSWNHLSPEEQRVFRNLTVFRGGFSREAAEHVAGASLSILAALVDKSMLRRNIAGRYEFHELLRQYGQEKLQEAGQMESTRDRHLAFFLKLAEEAEPHLEGPDQVRWLNKLEMEHDNLRAALDWSRSAQGTAEFGLRLAGSLMHFWGTGYFNEGRAYLSAVLSRPEAQEPTPTRAKALSSSARVAFEQGDFPAVRTLVEESQAIYRALGPEGKPGLTYTFFILGLTEAELGDYESAASLQKKALVILREMNDSKGIARGLRLLGWCAVRTGDYEQATHYFAEALPLARQTGNQIYVGYVLSGLGEIALRQGDYERATALLEEALALNRDVGSRWGIAALLGSLGWVALLQGDLKQAVTQLRESLALRREIGDRVGGTAWCLEKLAHVALLQGQRELTSRQEEDFRQSAQLFGAAEALRISSGSAMDLVDRPEYEGQLAIVRTQLGETVYAAAWAEGQAMTIEQAVDYALNLFE